MALVGQLGGVVRRYLQHLHRGVDAQRGGGSGSNQRQLAGEKPEVKVGYRVGKKVRVWTGGADDVTALLQYDLRHGMAQSHDIVLHVTWVRRIPNVVFPGL